ncbi:hypothetical protein JX266_000460 [Neoarthrinium moseri]|uniref:uncharacterized protein n=1 Tax=Neoarthrinium moseri TaxID=1658444 RepID=UPI001FDC2C10|nr:uncharacterized protein JN550_004217 [Neoarthrinium moseri]KAI1855595.1 hypothetical protein JX266_000460 [Neoarthrinium moseri]KAI1872014.1 hypothetical protein JN550_004217 [Neoarthrinium moseri]
MASWQESASRKRESVLAKIPEQWRLSESFCAVPITPNSLSRNVTTDAFLQTLPSAARLSQRELEITSETRISEILKNYESQHWTAEEVITAFCHRAAISHQMTESLSEIRFVEAVNEAKAHDNYLRANNKLIGPLHGIPVSLKDQFRVEGLETAMAYIGWLGNVETNQTESLLTKQIKSLGGIIVAKAKTVSNLQPPGLNPYNRLLSPGGSSGGEGSLLAFRGSVLGVGTDMGGSIRIPSAFNHLFGLKPSHGRISYKDLANSLAGKPVVPSVAGPMSTTLQNLIHFTKAIIESEGCGVDPALINMPWRQSKFDQVRIDAAAGGLCFATFPHDGVVKPHPTISRGVDSAIDAIRQAGHKVIGWDPPSHLEGSRIYAGIVFADVHDVHDAIRLSGEPLMTALEPLFGKDEPRKSMDMKDYYALVLRFRKYQEQYAEYWESTKTLTGTGRPVDGIITPVAAHAAVRHNSFFSYNYTIVYNILDYAAVTVPVTFADKNIDIARPYPEPLNDTDEKNWNAYDPEMYHGAPIGIQIVGRRLEEEKVLALAEVLSGVLRVTSS